MLFIRLRNIKHLVNSTWSFDFAILWYPNFPNLSNIFNRLLFLNFQSLSILYHQFSLRYTTILLTHGETMWNSSVSILIYKFCNLQEYSEASEFPNAIDSRQCSTEKVALSRGDFEPKTNRYRFLFRLKWTWRFRDTRQVWASQVNPPATLYTTGSNNGR